MADFVHSSASARFSWVAGVSVESEDQNDELGSTPHIKNKSISETPRFRPEEFRL